MQDSQDRGKPRSWVKRMAQVALYAVVSAVVNAEAKDLLDQLADDSSCE